MENDIGIDSCHDIIQNDTKSPFESFLKVADGKGFKNVEKSEEKKTDHDEADCFGNPEHGDEKTHHLIDDNPLIIFSSEKCLCIF